ncbi:type II toxin-antitoxin system PemK/MazF family toxin [Corynebacterium sp. 153RC1]|uniref:type II toxin-antitoxin system PemK/MazF family toxin n=1 Tax=unclassified Corynebacterium TaxID=2624378 RepID=UPI00211C93EC|nr:MULTISPECIES: type II toxin-antitoxin system PemK/MazF family toxin [unclassified Corynebacterium]MCQ9353232.1 type II toxin-antitoxin system PemK/MazF family toxin [Corynebacterium sp. 209RC1]MCQ9355372.1 type II toxin-antitoxin system PemK/MazF family toxin [Corynebacterium sp. 1222RC1]MCQ9357104.1 type II toxin-antitoxin system PemK/MazF family toxin [Corynebacterium sp. 122RC1]MCQ9358913.1 type II toxin-antitoxin system PemK/MazF family toxin [Corynebacterium sp. 142RC1]MCQ9360455.1 typ
MGTHTNRLHLTRRRSKTDASGMDKLRNFFRKHEETSATIGLDRISERLGLSNPSEDAARALENACIVCDAQTLSRDIVYAPDMDGKVDPGEVVWFWAPIDSRTKELTERAMVVIGRTGEHVLGLVTSTDPDHGEEYNWIDIGAGPWDGEGRQSWVRVDRVVQVPEYSIRREGAVLPQHRFERIANRLRTDFGWL